MKGIKYVILFFIILYPPLCQAQDLDETLNGFSLYTIIEGELGYTMKSKERTTGDSSDTDLFYNGSNSALGISYENNGLVGNFEIQYDKDGKTRIFYAWGAYDFDLFYFKMGIFDSPASFFSSEGLNHNNGFIGFGATAEEYPFMQLQVSINDFYINLSEPVTPEKSGNLYDIAGLTDVEDVDILFPKTILGYDFISPIFIASAGVAYQSFYISEGIMDGKIVNSFMTFLHGDINLGKIKLLFNLGYSINPGEYGLKQQVKNSVEVNLSSLEFENTSVFEGFFQAAYDFQHFKINLGYGYIQSSNKNWNHQDNAQAYFINCEIPVNDHMRITPEISIHDYMEDYLGADQGSELFIGTNLTVEF